MFESSIVTIFIESFSYEWEPYADVIRLRYGYDTDSFDPVTHKVKRKFAEVPSNHFRIIFSNKTPTIHQRKLKKHA